MKDFSLLLPTHERIILLKQFLESLVETAADLDNIEVILGIDNDDEESLKFKHPLISIKKAINSDNNMSSIFKSCYKESSGRFIILFNDDVIFRTRNWDKKILEAFSHFSDGLALVYCNDLYFGKRLPVFPILPRFVCEFKGAFRTFRYRRHRIDSHIFDIFQRLSALGHKRIAYLPDIIFEHMNYGVTLASYNNNNSQEADYSDDHNLYSSLADKRQKAAEKMVEYIESDNKRNSLSTVKTIPDNKLISGIRGV